jgi:UDP-N-acetylenolpyruvoylglucosamine reductase
VSAASLIEDAGLLQARSGEVGISERNANFIVVGERRLPATMCSRLIEHVRQGVADRMGVELELALEVLVTP